MALKICFECEKEKDLDCFYKHKKMKDGHFNKCKDCTKKAVIAYRARNIEKVRAYDRKRGSSKSRISENMKRTKVWRKKFPLKYKAYRELNNAVKNNLVIKPVICETCSKEGRQIEGHHDDYS